MIKRKQVITNFIKNFVQRNSFRSEKIGLFYHLCLCLFIKNLTYEKIHPAVYHYHISVAYLTLVDSHVCRLHKRYDPSTRTLRWSLRQNELCLCQGVVAPRTTNSLTCAIGDDAESIDSLWFTDDLTALTDRRNWKPAKLDELLARSHCCM